MANCSAGARNRKGAGAAASLDPMAILRDLQDLTAGAPVVHVEYGVGRYVGLQLMEVAGQEGEFLVIEYQGGDRIYVPGRFPASRESLHRRRAGCRAAAQARYGTVGAGPASRQRSRCAMWLPICLIFMHNGRHDAAQY